MKQEQVEVRHLGMNLVRACGICVCAGAVVLDVGVPGGGVRGAGVLRWDCFGRYVG